MKKNLLLYFFLSLSFTLLAFGDDFWSDTSPNGYQFHKYDGTSIQYKNKNGIHILDNLEKWYFKKEYTIGYYFKKNEDKVIKGYFISNEQKNNIELFENQQNWEKRINYLNINTLIWTRWYTRNWSFFPKEDSDGGGNFIIFIAFTILGVIFLFFFIIGAIFSLITKKINSYLKFSLYFIAIGSIIIGGGSLIYFLLGKFPQSI